MTETEADRVATLRTTHADAPLVAAALAPDDTDSIAARVDGDTITCTVTRPTTGGLRSTVDDYVVNLRVADRVIARARAHRDTDASNTDEDTDTDTTPTRHTTHE
ncbi:KEOPS complex Pcc1-like subunit [Halorubrum sp. JWXQ-INN 858]|uniref:KEOPS complex subunit Pcc1 n=1 Tax=Halorubrum sp. JWXQ-INN 858 TaxID=2690782 RepID=UPI00135AE31D|nr:KEOPS complex subunit Pcc1 [Halorubrum sp. JWXQ-INN 858]MWV65553.1 KEOPS complex Pcc1-like subunit [Halorubrum sp. JWXQ-INN 858]